MRRSSDRRQRADGRVAGLRQRRQLQLSNGHGRISLPAGRRPACRGSGRASARSPSGYRRPRGAAVAAGRRSTWQANALPSCMLTFGSATSDGQVVGVAADDLARRTPSGTGGRSGGRRAPRSRSGRSRRVTIARASIRPRADCTVSQPPWTMPRSAASSGLSSTNISGCNSLSQLVEPAHRPAQVVLGEPEGGGHHRDTRSSACGPCG